MKDPATPALLAPPRLAPDFAMPPYSYVPGLKFPHPTRSPCGHSFGRAECKSERPCADRWRECREFVEGIDLFNHGYYWEAHETWESLWHACGRQGRDADGLKGLIKLAAAGVKLREQIAEGARRHARRAAELLNSLDTDATWFGLDVGALARHADWVAEQAQTLVVELRDPPPLVAIVFPFTIVPESNSVPRG